MKKGGEAVRVQEKAKIIRNQKICDGSVSFCRIAFYP
jgi:hypothetical protein